MRKMSKYDDKEKVVSLEELKIDKELADIAISFMVPKIPSFLYQDIFPIIEDKDE